MIEEKQDLPQISNKQKEEKLAFAYAEVVRLMKKHLDDDKMIQSRVKIEMNKLLENILINICEKLNEYPYATIDYSMFKECAYPYMNIERIEQEKELILTHLNVIKADCDKMSSDVERIITTQQNDNL